MSKIDNDLGFEDMLGMFDADKTNVPTQKKIVATSIQKKSNTLDTTTNEKLINSSSPEKRKTVTREKHQNESKTDNDNPKNAKAGVSSSKKTKTFKDSIYSFLEDFSRAFTVGESFTSVRILKKKVKYLKLIFPEDSTIKIIDRLITNCLIENRDKVAKLKKDFFKDSL